LSLGHYVHVRDGEVRQGKVSRNR